MARYIVRHIPGLSSDNSSSFSENGLSISTHRLDSIIQTLLVECEIWDTQRDRDCPISNRTITEVRGAISRNCPSIGAHSVAGAPRCNFTVLAQRVAAFVAEQFVYEPQAWTPSSVLFAAWEDWCETRREPAGDDRSMFKELIRQSGSRIRRTRQRRSGTREPGYAGIDLQ
jgi:hypothetical protein